MKHHLVHGRVLDKDLFACSLDRFLICLSTDWVMSYNSALSHTFFYKVAALCIKTCWASQSTAVPLHKGNVSSATLPKPQSTSFYLSSNPQMALVIFPPLLPLWSLSPEGAVCYRWTISWQSAPLTLIPCTLASCEFMFITVSCTENLQ